MTYTRKPPKQVEVTLNLTWVEEPIILPSQLSAPFTGITRLSAGDPSELFDWLPDEISILLETASVGEVNEFFEEWIRKSKQAALEERVEMSAFQKIMLGLIEGKQ